MKVKRTYPCNHDGKIYGNGDTVEVPNEIGERWIKSGAAVSLVSGLKKSGTVYTEEAFKALGWDKAREVAGNMYKVHAASWDELIREFMAAQEKALVESGEK